MHAVCPLLYDDNYCCSSDDEKVTMCLRSVGNISLAMQLYNEYEKTKGKPKERVCVGCSSSGNDRHKGLCIYPPALVNNKVIWLCPSCFTSYNYRKDE